MKRIVTLLLVLLSLFTGQGFAQGTNLIEIGGTVTGPDGGQPLEGVTVMVKGTQAGTVTGNDGSFLLRTKNSFPLVLVFSSVGFQQQEFKVESFASKLSIAMVTQTMLGKDVVVTASRVRESILKSPVAIEKLDIRAIREAPAPSFYDALESVKGVQMTTSSLTLKVPNTRGFNSPNNFRFMQLVDGIDMQAATLGVPLGNAIGPTELDIASVEITPGAASALYGMNAINGMANLLTKSPYNYQGLSVYQKVGVNHVDGRDHAPAALTETAIRYAKAYKNGFAFKVNAAYMRGTDWRSTGRTDQNPNYLKSANPQFQQLNGPANAAYDGWNKYGDDALTGSNTVSISGLTINGAANQTLRVARTGYWETDLVQPQVDNLKLDASLHYRFGSNTEVTYSYRVGKMDGVFQRGNKIQLDNVVVQNHTFHLKAGHFNWKSYISTENTGDSYNVKPLADNLDLASGGSNAAWAAKFKAALTSQLNAGVDLATATANARTAADASRVVPGTPAFNALKNQIVAINNWDIQSPQTPDAPATGGAALLQRSRMYHTEAQYDFSHLTKKYIDLLAGADVRVYEVLPDGNNFVDFSRPLADRNKALPNGSYGNNVYYKKVGGFVQASRQLLNNTLKLYASLRSDYNPEFKPTFTPRLAAVYTYQKNHHLRLTWQQGYRFPALFEALSFVNNGRVRRVGSLPFINEGLGYLQNSYTQASVVAFNAAVSADGNTDASALKNRGILQVANLPAARPEKINALEAGYKSVLFNNRLVIDLDVYSNVYSHFLGQVQVYVPKGETVGSDAAVLAMLDRNRDATATTGTTAASKGQERYRVYTNARNTYHNFGSALGVTYSLWGKYTIRGNSSYNKMKASRQSDVFVTGFNTPEWTANAAFGNREVVKNVGFNVAARWQDAFTWESPLATGRVPAYTTFDAQVTVKVPKWHSTIKGGGANVFNKRYIQYAAGPTIGALYYVAATISLD